MRMALCQMSQRLYSSSPAGAGPIHSSQLARINKLSTACTSSLLKINSPVFALVVGQGLLTGT